MRWPLGVAAVAAVFVTVNAVYIWVAVSGADPVVTSYTETQHR